MKYQVYRPNKIVRLTSFEKIIIEILNIRSLKRRNFSFTKVRNNISFYIKTNFNALNDEKLFEELKQTGRKNIIVMGIETHICVYQTVVALLQHDFDVTVISDACGSRSAEEYQSGLLTMKDYGAKIKSTEMVLFEILKTARHPKFKDIQALIK